ncbi:MAG: condensation domain-containing protein, partial [Psychrosphaera sp.]|nr:condensation domain-containing protein [Psychrosphaera sp.]
QTEQKLADVWAQLLTIKPDAVRRTANFFDLGGHSLLCIRLVASIRTAFDIEVSVQSIFDNATLQTLAVVIEQSNVHGSTNAVRPPLVPLERTDNKVAVSYAQQRLWFIDSLQEGGTPEYNMPVAFNVTGKLDMTLLSAVFNTIIERHAVLRTVYVEQDGLALQHIRAMNDIEFELNLIDLSDLSRSKLAAQVKLQIAADITKTFDLASDLMLRVSYVKKTADTGVLLFNMHHIASDGWSLQVLTKEFFTLFKAYSKKQGNPLPPMAIQYADYAHWQRANLTDDILGQQLDYWQKQLDELPVVHGLPLDFERPRIKRHEGAIVSSTLPATTAEQLLLVAKSHQITPFMLMHGALSLLLSRHSNSNDIVIGIPVANRLQGELEPLIGFFVNTLVLRVDTNHATLPDYFGHVRQLHLDAQSHQEVPFEQLVERLNVPRSTAHSPLFQIMMTTNGAGVLNDISNNAMSLPGIDFEVCPSTLVQEKFDLTVDITVNEQGVALAWSFDVSLFTAEHINQLNDHLCRLLEGLSQTATQPYQAPHQLPMLSQDQTQHLMYDLNQTVVDYDKAMCIHTLFEQQAAANPDNIAVVDVHGSTNAVGAGMRRSGEGMQMTYQQLNQKANQLAHYLKEHHHVKPDTLIGLCVDRSLEMVIGIMAILKAGGAYVPLDPGYPQDRINYMLEDAA